MYKDALRYLTLPARSLRTFPGKLLFGPSGDRLTADVVDPVPGFQGRFDFIHKMNIPLLFTVSIKNPDLLSPMDVTWMPHALHQAVENDSLSFSEDKWITWDDIAISVQHWENKSNTPLTLKLILPKETKSNVCVFPVCIHGITPTMMVSFGNEWKARKLTLAPRESRDILLFAACVPKGETDLARQRLASLSARTPDDLIKEQIKNYGSWFDDVPSFTCSDPYFEACWWYRWYLLRVNLADPKFGNFSSPVLYEGRSHRMDKTCYQTKGWEFSRLIPLSTPLQMLDLEWSNNHEVLKDIIRSLCDSAGEDGSFQVTSADTCEKAYAQFGAWALYQCVLSTGDLSFAREVLPAFKTDVRAVLASHKGNDDLLQIETVHQLTGKEYQPGYWYFSDYPDKVKGTTEGYTPLKRVDRSVYTYLNLLGLGRLCTLLQDPDADEFLQTAEILKNQILDKMWDEEDGFFYDLHPETNEKARVKHIVGFDPYFAEITGDREWEALAKAFDAKLFNLGSGLASTAADCAVFSASGGWKNLYFKGRDGCMWNGPSWPFTTCMTIDGLAIQSKKHGHVYDQEVNKLLKSYTMEHFRYHDIKQPYLVEFYNSITGEALSDEPDYLHSYWIELIVRHIAGIEADEEGFTFAPLIPSVSSFSLTDLPLRGHLIDVSYTKNDNFTLKLDGQILFQGSGEERPWFTLPLKIECNVL